MTDNKNKWEELIRSDLRPYNVCVPFHSIQFSNEYVGGPKYQNLFLYVKDDIGYYYENFEDHFLVGEYCLDLFLNDFDKFDSYVDFWKSEFQKLNDFLNETNEVGLRKLKNDELSSLLKEVYTKSIYWHGIAYNVDAIDTVLIPLIEKEIVVCNPGVKKSRISEIYNAITFPDVLSYVNRMNLEKMELFSDLSNGKIEKDGNEVEKFVKQYYWVNFTFGESEEYAREIFLREFEEINKSDIESELGSIRKRFDSAMKSKKREIDLLKEKSSKIKDYLKIFEAYAIFHDLRKEGQVKSVHLIRKIYKELAKRLKVNLNLFYYYWPLEAIELIGGGGDADVELLKRRSGKYFCEFRNNGESFEGYGDDAEKRRKEISGFDENVNIQEIDGTSASQGRITGAVKVCLSANDSNERVEEGDILVTGMTMPEFVPSMKKAAAIVTDEGGLTCHAAIIARELGKPCVVGTKIATQVLKDGDLVEVNANHGVVKILN